jgi:HlyD family secretion protein
MLIKSMARARSIVVKIAKKFTSLSWRKKILSIAVVLIVLIIALGQISSLTAPPSYTSQKVEKSNITEVVTESGNISLNGKINVYSPTEGVVTEVLVKNGDYVEEGDILFKAESSATEQESQQAYSTYLSAVSTLNAAQSTADTLRAGMYTQWKSFTDIATNSTYEKGDDTPNVENRQAAEFQIAQDTWKAAEKKFKDQETAISQAKALVASTNILYMATKDSIVKAQSNGIVTNLSVAKGSSVSISNPALASSVKPALIISQEAQTEAAILISESDISKVQEGQMVNIKVNALDNKQFAASVARVDQIGTNTQGVITYTAYINFNTDNVLLKPGMTVDADIVTKELKNVLSVPNSAVKPYKGGRAVRVPDSSKPEKFRYVPVEIGIRGKEKTQILKGVEENTEIITALSNEALKRSGPFGN